MRVSLVCVVHAVIFVAHGASSVYLLSYGTCQCSWPSHGLLLRSSSRQRCCGCDGTRLVSVRVALAWHIAVQHVGAVLAAALCDAQLLVPWHDAGFLAARGTEHQRTVAAVLQRKHNHPTHKQAHRSAPSGVAPLLPTPHPHPHGHTSTPTYVSAREERELPGAVQALLELLVGRP